MLYFSTIEPATLELLRNISRRDIFKNCRLVGGTSLALQLGHRKSIDLDFFGTIDFESTAFKHFIEEFEKVEILVKSRNIRTYTLNNIKVDFVNYSYPWLDDPLKQETLILAKPRDIAAMKISAITGRGSKKDFVDLYFLLQMYSLTDIFALYRKKYQDGSEYLALKSLSFFDDAEEDADPVMLTDVSWDSIKERIIKEVIAFAKL